MTVGFGLLSMLSFTTATGAWIGYQIVGGAGRGCGLQMVRPFIPALTPSLTLHFQPIVAMQNTIPAKQGPVGMAVLIFAQTFGGSIWLAVAQTTFDSSLSSALAKYAPGVSPKLVATAGATGFRQSFSAADVERIIRAYGESVDHVFYLAAGLAGVTFLFSWGLGWKSVKKAKVVAPEA